MADGLATTAHGDAPPLPISVVIPAYNRETMVGRALASVWAQRPRPPAEVIVIDDCSTDGTGTIAAELGARVIRHERNRGLAAARNTGTHAASQPWVAMLDSDDEWLPHLLDELWRERDGHVFVSLASINCGSDPARDRFAGATGRHPLLLDSPTKLVYPENFIAASGAMVRCDVVRAAGGYKEGLSPGEDLDFWLRALEHGTALALPKVGVIYYLHDGQLTHDKSAMADRQLEVLRSYSDRRWWSAGRVEAWRGGVAWDTARRNGGRTALRSARFVAGHPARVLGLAGIRVGRWRLRRRSSSVTRHGTPTVAVVSRSAELRDQVAGEVGADGLHPASKRPLVAGLLALARRPAGVAVVDSALGRLAARTLMVRPVRREELAELLGRPWSPDGR
jgi:GT2 family glycosyltransferase